MIDLQTSILFAYVEKAHPSLLSFLNLKKLLNETAIIDTHSEIIIFSYNFFYYSILKVNVLIDKCIV